MYKRILVPVDGSEVCVSCFDYEGEVFDAARRRAHKVLADAQAMAESAGAPADTRLVETADSRLGEVVAQQAREWEADLVTVGTHARRGVSRLMLGSGAEQVPRLAPVRVLAVRAG